MRALPAVPALLLACLVALLAAVVVAGAGASSKLPPTARTVAQLQREVTQLETELRDMQAQVDELRGPVSGLVHEVDAAIRESEDERRSAAGVAAVPLEELEALPRQIAELEDALDNVERALEDLRDAERTRLRLPVDAVIPAEAAINPELAKRAAAVSAGKPTVPPRLPQNQCADVYVPSRSRGGGWYIPVTFLQTRGNKITVISSGLNGDHGSDEALMDLLATNSTPNALINVYVADPDYRAAAWGERLPKVLRGIHYLPDTIIGGQSQRTTYGEFYEKYGLTLPREMEGVRQSQLVVHSLVGLIKLAGSVYFDIVKLDVPPGLHHWARHIRDLDRIHVQMLLINFLDDDEHGVVPGAPLASLFAGEQKWRSPRTSPVWLGLDAVPPQEQQELTTFATYEDVVWYITTQLQWRLYKVNPHTRRSFTFLHTCGTNDPPCGCCRKTVPLHCSLLPSQQGA